MNVWHVWWTWVVRFRRERERERAGLEIPRMCLNEKKQHKTNIEINQTKSTNENKIKLKSTKTKTKTILLLVNPQSKTRKSVLYKIESHSDNFAHGFGRIVQAPKFVQTNIRTECFVIAILSQSTVISITISFRFSFRAG